MSIVWNPGQQLQNGKYVIGEVLGRGGFGITYKALHVRLQEQIVVKTPDKYLKTDPEYSKFNDGIRVQSNSRFPFPFNLSPR